METTSTLEITPKKVGFYTLGCKLNFSETSTIARQFEAGGYRRAERGEVADIYVINTCSVTEHADKKCRNLIRKLIQENSDAIVAVTGCYAQLKPDEIAAIPGVDLVIGNQEKGTLAERVFELTRKSKGVIHHCESEEITSFFAAFSLGDRTRAFLKVQDGCDYHCAYCTIPLARGHSRNISISDLVREAQQIARGGQKEIVITGINTGDFGRTTGEHFLDLLQALNAVEGIERYRISSIEPNLLTDEIIAFTAKSPKFQPHFHVPLQAGSDRILGLMRRRYTTETFASRVKALRKAIPDAFIGIDVIVGFPGETEADFQATYDFLEQLAPAFLHLFPYSERPNTPAIHFPDKVAPEVSRRRLEALEKLSEKGHRTFASRFTGRSARVLLESTKRGGLMFGYSENYLKVELPYQKNCVNQIHTVRLVELLENGDFRGEWEVSQDK